MAAKEITIRETTVKHHRPSLDELYDFIARFRGPGKILLHVSFGGHIQQFDVITSETEKPQSTPLQQKA